jgi:hypothetical protein
METVKSQQMRLELRCSHEPFWDIRFFPPPGPLWPAYSETSIEKGEMNRIGLYKRCVQF